MQRKWRMLFIVGLAALGLAVWGGVQVFASGSPPMAAPAGAKLPQAAFSQVVTTGHPGNTWINTGFADQSAGFGDPITGGDTVVSFQLRRPPRSSVFDYPVLVLCAW